MQTVYSFKVNISPAICNGVNDTSTSSKLLLSMVNCTNQLKTGTQAEDLPTGPSTVEDEAKLPHSVFVLTPEELVYIHFRSNNLKCRQCSQRQEKHGCSLVGVLVFAKLDRDKCIFA